MKAASSYEEALAALPPALRPIAEAIAPVVAALLREQPRDGDPLVDVCAAVPRSRRAVQRACREGAIAGATKSGRKWLARRSSVDAWLAKARPSSSAASEPEGDDEGDELDSLRQDFGLRLVGGTQASKGGR